MPIFDQGYQHWQGTLSGHGWRWLTVARHGVRAGMQNRWIRLTVLCAWVPALVLASFLCLWGMVEQKKPWAIALLSGFLPAPEVLNDPVAFRLPVWALAFHKFLQVEMFFVMILVLMVGPGLISQDLRFNALPLYFSRPVRRVDYFLGKLGVITYFLGLVTAVPGVIAWVLGVLFSLDFSVPASTARILLAVVLYGVAVSLSAGLLMLALSSLSRNSRYVGVLWAGFWLLTLIVSFILEVFHQEEYKRRLYQAQMVQQNGAVQEAWRREQAEAARDAQDPKMPPAVRERRERERQGRMMLWQQAQAEEYGGARKRIKEELAPSFERDWRPLVDYTNNLLRIGDALLGAYDAQDQFAALLSNARKAAGGHGSEDFVLDTPPDPRWPWYWSGLVLLALAGVSLWILTTRVRTLDRLR
jgi:ABC-2 type transport system permease protein